MDNKGYDSNGDAQIPSDVSVSIPEEKKEPLDATFDDGTNQEKPRADKPYAGMGKEDLIRFSDTPFWNRFRMACLVIFWLAWLGLLIAVIVMTITFPRCTAPEEKSWWQKSVFYQVFVRSFSDGQGNDGVGDLRGIVDKLDHVVDINANAIILSSIYESDGDFGYSIINHKGVDGTLGTLDDFEYLLEAAHNKSIKVLLDFIPNHTSQNHTWFTASRSSSSTSNEKWNYYIWANCGEKPNWRTVYNQEAWTQNTDGRGQCYFHQFMDNQPDLNLRDAGVQEELDNILRYWLDLGIDGFRVTSAKFLFEDTGLRNETLKDGCNNPNDVACYDHTYTQNLPETHAILARWRSVINEYSTQDNPKILISDAMNEEVNISLAYYGRFGSNEVDLPVNYGLQQYTTSCAGSCVRQLINNWLAHMPEDGTANWLTDYQDMNRMATNVDQTHMNAVNMLKFTLPGSTFVQYGEETGMSNGDISNTDIRDPAWYIDPTYGRDNYRTPMQWNSGPNAGFTSGTPWLPVNTDYTYKNVEHLNNATNGANNTLSMFRTLAGIRRNQNSLHYGNFHWLVEDHPNVVAYLREYEGDDRVLVAANFGDSESSVDLEKDQSLVGESGHVLAVTTQDMAIKVGDSTNLRELRLGPGHGVIVSWAYTR